MVAQPAGGVCAKPKSVKSMLSTLAFRVMVGWGCDLRFTHVFRRLSKRWWSTGRFCLGCQSWLIVSHFWRVVLGLSSVANRKFPWSVSIAEALVLPVLFLQR